ncbi:MAG: hypothetical protein V7L00_04295 [Nostoc sp.]|uniref:hypothetical protein n=1 Tax=Nostoc sp. TaxID=1180 RepID=UPI002FF75A89
MADSIYLSRFYGLYYLARVFHPEELKKLHIISQTRLIASLLNTPVQTRLIASLLYGRD